LKISCFSTGLRANCFQEVNRLSSSNNVVVIFCVIQNCLRSSTYLRLSNRNCGRWIITIFNSLVSMQIAYFDTDQLQGSRNPLPSSSLAFRCTVPHALSMSYNTSKKDTAPLLNFVFSPWRMVDHRSSGYKSVYFHSEQTTIIYICV